LLLKTDPKLTESFTNKLWIKFFLTAVFSTMWIRDHQRPVFHEALGVDVTWYGQEVVRKTSDITKQVFPMTLDIDNPRWRRGLDKLQDANILIAEGKKSGNHFKRLWGTARAGMIFLNLLTIPAIPNEVPESARMEPVY
jgi:magnesium-protoporphyrin IX monomethyl ester (oxidative) cyclase